MTRRVTEQPPASCPTREVVEMKNTIQHNNYLISEDIAHFVQAYIKYGHRLDLLKDMFNVSRSTVNRWLKSREFEAEYNNQVENGAYICEAMCEREAPRSLMSLIAGRDDLQVLVDQKKATIHEKRLLREINKDILDYILGGKLRLEHTGKNGGAIEYKDAEKLTDEELDARIKKLLSEGF